MPTDAAGWNEHYQKGEIPWDSGVPSAELERILSEGWFQPCRMLEFGCGTGTNAIFLAQQGFDVTAVDVAELAIAKAKEKAAQAGAKVRFLQADILQLPNLGEPFRFVFDRGVYHALRRTDLDRFREVLAQVTQPGGHYLTLAGNANENRPPDQGPPVVHAHEMCLELSPLFDLVQLREFRFDGVVIEGQDVQPLAWSAVWRRKETA